MMIERVLELLRESLDLQTFLLQSVAKFNDLFLIATNLFGFFDFKFEVTLELADFVAEKLYVPKTLTVLDLSIGNCCF